MINLTKLICSLFFNFVLGVPMNLHIFIRYDFFCLKNGLSRTHLFKLNVNGNIITQKFIISRLTKNDCHLPNIPTADEAIQNGVNIGGMLAKLL